MSRLKYFLIPVFSGVILINIFSKNVNVNADQITILEIRALADGDGENEEPPDWPPPGSPMPLPDTIPPLGSTIYMLSN